MSLRLPFAMLLALLLISGCSSVGPEKYAEIQSGMTRQEVYALLGEPDEITGGGVGSLSFSSETWTGRKHRIHITFTGDKVALKSIAGIDGTPAER